jgi:YD repeat-containing protein
MAPLQNGRSTGAADLLREYDANDCLIEVKSALGQINYSLDANGNITHHSVAGAGTTQHEYDDAGRLVKLIAPDKQARYSYDAAGRLTTTERATSEQLPLRYDPDKRLTGRCRVEPPSLAIAKSRNLLGQINYSLDPNSHTETRRTLPPVFAALMRATHC